MRNETRPQVPDGAFARWLASDGDEPAPESDSAALRQAVLQAPGFVEVDLALIPSERWKHAFLRLASLTGELMKQDSAGTMLLDIVASDPSHAMETTFHTDGAFSPRAPDAFGLLCLQPAPHGGGLQLINAYTLLDEVERRFPGASGVLSKPVAFYAPHQIVPGESALPEVRLVERTAEGELVLRYLSLQIDRARLLPEQRRLLAHMEDALRAIPPVEVGLGRGTCTLINNRWILHNRARFIFSSHAADRRHTVRAWLSFQPCDQGASHV